MSSEHRRTKLEDQVRSFADALELETGEPIRPVRPRPRTDTDVDVVVDVVSLENLAPAPPERRHGLVAAMAAAAAVVFVVGGLVVLGNNATPADDPAPAQSVGPRPDVSSTPDPSVTTEARLPDSSDVPAPTAEAQINPTVATTIPDREPVWRGGLLANLETDALLPLDSAGNADFVVPTAPVDWRILSGGFGRNGDFSNSAVAIIEGRPDGTTGPWIEMTVSILGICESRTDVDCATSGETAEINGVVWQAFTELIGVRAVIGDRVIDVTADDLELQGQLLDEPLMLEYLEGLRVGTGDLYWDTIRTEIGQACWDCSDPLQPLDDVTE